MRVILIALFVVAAGIAVPTHVAAQVSDSLIARIEGPGTDGPRGIDFPLARTSCP